MLTTLARLFGLQRDDVPAPPDVDPRTLAGAKARGLDGGSGMTANPVSYIDAGGRVDDLGHYVVPATAQTPQDLTPASAYADRALYGGVRVAPATREYVEPPGMTGGHEVIVPFPIVQPDRMTAVPTGTPAATRQVPTSATSSTAPGSCDERNICASDGVADVAALQRDSAAASLGWSS